MIETILPLAMTVLPKQTAKLYRWKDRSVNSRGLEEDVFETPVALAGSIQPVDRTRLAFFGLNEMQSYISIYTTEPLRAMTDTANPDQVEYAGRRYGVMSCADWQAPAGYTGILAVDIGPARENAP